MHTLKNYFQTVIDLFKYIYINQQIMSYQQFIPLFLSAAHERKEHLF